MTIIVDTPWKTVSPSQFEFLCLAVESHQWADLRTMFEPTQLQERLTWGWDLVLAGKLSVEDAIEEIYETNNTRNMIEKHIQSKTNKGDAFAVKVGDKIFKEKEGVFQEITVTGVSVDFNCCYGGVYPINIAYIVDGRETEGWYDCFGLGADEDRLHQTFVSKITEKELKKVHQGFMENLYAHYLWQNYSDTQEDVDLRLEKVESLFEDFSKQDNLLTLTQDKNELQKAVKHFVDRELKAYE